MRKIIVISMITLDGVIQGPGGPEEDNSGDFKYGGWVAPYSDEEDHEVMAHLMQPADLLLGSVTFGIWEDYWPKHAQAWPGINEVEKYVLSSTRSATHWQNVVFLNNVEDIKELKAKEGGDIKVWGSSKLVQLLLRHDLVDELWLLTYPIVLGEGKKLFDRSFHAAAFRLMQSKITPSGVIIAAYERAGAVATGRVGI